MVFCCNLRAITFGILGQLDRDLMGALQMFSVDRGEADLAKPATDYHSSDTACYSAQVLVGYLNKHLKKVMEKSVFGAVS